MMDWSEYIAQILARNSSFDGISLSFGDDRKPIGVPPLIKSSVLMLDRMLECQGKFNILTLQLYAHSTTESKRNAMESLEDFL